MSWYTKNFESNKREVQDTFDEGKTLAKAVATEKKLSKSLKGGKPKKHLQFGTASYEKPKIL